MPGWVKVAATKLDNLSLTPQDPHGGRREPLLASCHLTTTHLLQHTLMSVHTHMLNKEM